MTAEEMYKNLRYVVTMDGKITVAAFEDEYDAQKYADEKSQDGHSYDVDLVITNKHETTKERTQVMNPIKEAYLVVSGKLDRDIRHNERLEQEVKRAYTRFKSLDWGDTQPDDKSFNDQALDTGDRIIAKYQTSTEPIYIINSDEVVRYDQTTGEDVTNRTTHIMYCREYQA